MFFYIPLRYRLISLTLHYCSKAVYRKHRLQLALQLALSLNSVPDSEKRFLLEEVPLNDDEDSDYKVPDWIPEERRLSVQSLVASFPQVIQFLPIQKNNKNN